MIANLTYGFLHHKLKSAELSCIKLLCTSDYINFDHCLSWILYLLLVFNHHHFQSQHKQGHDLLFLLDSC